LSYLVDRPEKHALSNRVDSKAETQGHDDARPGNIVGERLHWGTAGSAVR